MSCLLITFFFSLVSITLGASDASNIDPIVNFCKRLDHQSTIKNGTLYIDGGIEIFNTSRAPGGNQTIGYNTYLLEVDMLTSWDWKKNISIVAVNKTANPQTGTDPPLVVRGALYPGSAYDNNIYLYGGTVDFMNTSFPGFQWPTSDQYSLWSYDTVGKTWGQYDVTLNAPNRPASGAYTGAPEVGLAFWLNGEIDTGSSNHVGHLQDFERYLDGLVVIDTNGQTARNLSTGSLANSPRIGSSMAYVSGVGSKGILVAIGGITRSVEYSSNATAGTYVTLDTIDFFDVASIDNVNENGSWYSQKATGDIPEPRTDFCLVAASAPDKSSYNIYMYGGMDGNQVFDQIYTLSLPSFTWTKIYEGEYPRYGHTCHFVGNRQMITVGGVKDTDLQRECDWETKSVAIYDLTDLTWGSVYDAFAPQYEVPALIYSVIGGGAKGGANMTVPSSGFSSAEIAQLFGTSNNNSANGTSSSGASTSIGSGISGGAIAGATIGSVAGVSLIAALAFFLFRRRRRAAAEHPPDYSGTDAKSDSQGGIIVRNRPDRMVELSSTRGLNELPAQGNVHESAPDTVIHEVDTDRRIAELEGSSSSTKIKE